MCKRHKKKEKPNLIHLLTNIYIKQVSIYLKSNASNADYHRFLMRLSLRCGLFDSTQFDFYKKSQYQTNHRVLDYFSTKGFD